MDTVNNDVPAPPGVRAMVDVLNDAVRPGELDTAREMEPEKEFRLLKVITELLEPA